MGLEYIKIRKNELGMTTEELSEISGVPVGTLNKILAGQTTDPKFETLKALCKALGIKLSDLEDYEVQDDEKGTYYLDPAAAAMAQELKTRPEMKVLFDATRNVSPEDIQFVIDMLDRLKK